MIAVIHLIQSNTYSYFVKNTFPSFHFQCGGSRSSPVKRWIRAIAATSPQRYSDNPERDTGAAWGEKEKERTSYLHLTSYPQYFPANMLSIQWLRQPWLSWVCMYESFISQYYIKWPPGTSWSIFNSSYYSGYSECFWFTTGYLNL